MQKAEMASNAVTELPTLCAQNGLQWFHVPIEDDRAPAEDFAVAWQAQRQAVHRLLDAGERVAVHCKGGSGRTGLMVAQILVERGYAKEDALVAVKALRPNALTLAVHQDYLARCRTSAYIRAAR
jgi:protein-tyrosine phosphatase